MSTFKRTLALAAVTAFVGLVPVAAQAADTQVIWTGGRGGEGTLNCYKSMVGVGNEATLPPSALATTAQMGAIYSAGPIAGGELSQGSQYRWVVINGVKCVALADRLAEVAGSLDPATFTTSVVVTSDGAFFEADPTVYSLPNINSTVVEEPEKGTLYQAASWTTAGTQKSLATDNRFTPVKTSTGVVGWIPTPTIAAVPSYSTADYTGSATLAYDVPLYFAPSTDSDLLSTVPTGQQVRTVPTMFGDWIAVSTGAQSGWMRLADMDGSTADTQAPDPQTSTDSWLDKAKQSASDAKDKAAAKVDEIEAQHAQNAAADGDQHPVRDGAKTAKTKALSWWEAAKGRAADNPISQSLARPALYGAAFLACIAIALAGLALVGRTLLGKVLKRLPLLGRAVRGAMPLAMLTGLWAAKVAPEHFFTTEVAAGLVITGASVGLAVATGLGSASLTQRLANPIGRVVAPLAGCGVAAIAWLALGWGWVTTAYVGLVGAGLGLALVGLVLRPQVDEDLSIYVDPGAEPDQIREPQEATR